MNDQTPFSVAEQAWLEQLHQRRRFFARRLSELPNARNGSGTTALPNTCPSCGYPTLGERNGWEICFICHWEDDGQDDFAADEVWGGPNGDASLTSWRLEFGALVNQLTQAPQADDRLEMLLHQALRKLVQMEQDCLNSANPVHFQDLIAQIELVADRFQEWRSPADQS